MASLGSITISTMWNRTQGGDATYNFPHFPLASVARLPCLLVIVCTITSLSVDPWAHWRLVSWKSYTLTRAAAITMISRNKWKKNESSTKIRLQRRDWRVRDEDCVFSLGSHRLAVAVINWITVTCIIWIRKEGNFLISSRPEKHNFSRSTKFISFQHAVRAHWSEMGWKYLIRLEWVMT